MPKNTQDKSEAPRLLLIDDEEGFVNVMAKRMEKRGFIVTKALSGSLALQLLRKTDCNLVVLDLKIEDMDGIEILKILKKMAPEIPVIMLSGHGSEEEAKKGIDLGAFDYVTKPCDFDDLIKKIRLACEHGGKCHGEF